MSGLFPNSGVPAGDAFNSLPDPNTMPGCNELWYSTSRCQPRFDPSQNNAVISELINLVNRSGLSYDCNRLDNVERAVRYVVQKGLPIGGYMLGGPLDYNLELDPTIQNVNDYMCLTLVASATNDGPVRLNIDNSGLYPLVRNDGLPLDRGDLTVNIPFVACYFRGMWYLPFFVRSQMPKTLKANLKIYVNGVTGDDADTGESPGSAVRTIQRAINLAFSYPPSQFVISINVADYLGYDGFYTPIWGGPNMHIIGNRNNPQNVVVTGQNTHAVTIAGNNVVTIYGLTATTTLNAQGPGGGFISTTGAILTCYDCRNLYVAGGVYEAYNANLTMGAHRYAGGAATLWWAALGGLVQGISKIPGFVHTIEVPITVTSAVCTASINSAVVVGSEPYTPVWVNPGAVTGQKYHASVNSSIYVSGKGPNYFPGTQPGVVSYNGLYV